ncbi:hypothetical protein CUMW_246220 [Citrus unshiu]|uniref:Uncharacterized protein n=1 Tax=Citrus unshiu TaxID=55188 RepID=A0A2H5QND7_CITUN|nr:hypothetical protein CUMW_246220 [Citrus unshiu]
MNEMTENMKRRIKGTHHNNDMDEWPIIDPLPSYGRGRERLVGRHISLIHVDHLTNVVMTGCCRRKNSSHTGWQPNPDPDRTRIEPGKSGPGSTLTEIICIRNLDKFLTTRIFPGPDPIRSFAAWPLITFTVRLCSFHHSSASFVSSLTLSRPAKRVEIHFSCDCYIESGNGLVAVKSGWDHDGIAMARPSSNIAVRRVSGTTPTCSGVGIGREMSGRIFNRVKIPIKISRGSNGHPDEGRDPKAIPKIRGISFVNVFSVNTTKAPICMKNVSLLVLAPSVKWQCQFVSGFNGQVFPLPCPQLQNKSSSWCSFLEFSGEDLNFGVQMNCILGMETAFSKLRLQY